MKFYIVSFMMLIFVQNIQAAFRVSEQHSTSFPYQRPPAYKLLQNSCDQVQQLINQDFGYRLLALKQQNPESEKYKSWTVHYYETELRGYTSDHKLILSDNVHQAIAICLLNLKYHGKLEQFIFKKWKDIAEQLRIKDSSIQAVEEKIKEYDPSL